MKYTFPEGFRLGATGAGWQMEGEKDKRPDQKHFPHLMWENDRDAWYLGLGPDVASDFYSRFRQDIPLFRQAGILQYRFNIDWSRFLDDYENVVVNEKAAQYYSDVIDCLMENGIEPILCLEHWELPAVLYEKYDGYASRHVQDLYVRYAAEAFRRYGDRVKTWFCFNEPMVIPELCFLNGFWWPHEHNPRRAYQWIHGKVMCTARTVEQFHRMIPDGKIGTILNSPYIVPRDASDPADARAAEIADAFFWRPFTDTAILGHYPQLYLDILKKEGLMFDLTEEDERIIAENTIDILGMNYYQPMRVKAKESAWDDSKPFHPSKYYDDYDMPGKRMNPFRGWEIYPRSLYDIGMRIKNEYGNIDWVVSESGMGVQNEEMYKDENGVIQDDYRIAFIAEHLAWLSKCVAEGSNCHGYWLFASLDNCSPYNTFKNRYGLLEVDRAQNLDRRLKKSAAWYRAAAESNSFEFEEI
ncbi:MAG: glycoside hydrolase family 1 protein [Candidatus Spyradocola sp.]